MDTNQWAFFPIGSTYLIPAAVTASTGVQIVSQNERDVAHRIVNTGAVDAFVGYGVLAATAEANAVIPTAGNPRLCILVKAGDTTVVRLPSNTFLSGIVASTTANLYVTPGKGIG
jgi:tRNA A37 threonylcarbamoyladenosine synthetase subunit TsaC/SUA5/YrdC